MVGLRCFAVHYREQQPTFIPPMLLTSGTLPSGDAWTFELKWDGCRVQLRYDGRSVSLRTRNGRECSADFPELAAIADVLGKRRVTLDGELVCLRGDGRPDFARLRHRLTGSLIDRRPAMLQVFDVLHLDGHSTRPLPYSERRSLLDELALDGPAWRAPASVVVERSEDFVARVEELGLEGVVAKRLSSRYLPGRRCTSWVKRKLRRDERLAVTGIRRTREGHMEAIFVARPDPTGHSLVPAQSSSGFTASLSSSSRTDSRNCGLDATARSVGIRPRCPCSHPFTACPTDPCATRSCAKS